MNQSINEAPSPTELQAMLDDLSLDPDLRASLERLLELTLQAQQRATLGRKPAPHTDPEVVRMPYKDE